MLDLDKRLLHGFDRSPRLQALDPSFSLEQPLVDLVNLEVRFNGPIAIYHAGAEHGDIHSAVSSSPVFWYVLEVHKKRMHT